MKKKNILMIGMPASGKSTIGVLLAKRLGYSIVDVDLVIQEKTGKLGFDQYWKGYFGDLDEIYFPYLWQAGGDIVDADGNLTLDSDAALKAAEFVYSLKTEGILPESCVSRDADAVTQDFRNG